MLELLSGCDVVFSCVDRHAPRAVLNELAYQCFVPVIDVGVGLTSEDGNVPGGSVRATLLGPNRPCLWCQEIVRAEMITAEHLSPSVYEARRAEGYVDDLDPHAPSVICYTTLAASLGLILFLNFLSDDVHPIPTLLLDLHSMDVIHINPNIKPDCVCTKRLGMGFKMPFSSAD